MFESVENKFKIYDDNNEFTPDEVNSILLSHKADRILIYTLRNLLNKKCECLRWAVGGNEELYLCHYLYDQKWSEPYKLYVVTNPESLDNILRYNETTKRFFAYVGNISEKIIFFDNEGIEDFKLTFESDLPF